MRPATLLNSVLLVELKPTYASIVATSKCDAKVMEIQKQICLPVW